MFICERCGSQTQASEPMSKIVFEKREVIYRNHVKGWEIVKEISVCTDCFEKEKKQREKVNV